MLHHGALAYRVPGNGFNPHYQEKKSQTTKDNKTSPYYPLLDNAHGKQLLNHQDVVFAALTYVVPHSYSR